MYIHIYIYIYSYINLYIHLCTYICMYYHIQSTVTDMIATELERQDIYDSDLPGKENSFYYIFGAVSSPVIAIVGMSGLFTSVLLAVIAHMTLTYSKQVCVNVEKRYAHTYRRCIRIYNAVERVFVICLSSVFGFTSWLTR